MVGLAVSVVGLIATLGVVVYEIRNSQLYDAAVHRLKFLEQLLSLPASAEFGVAGIFGERPQRPVIGRLPLWHDLALALVYGASTGAWTWLLVNSARDVKPWGPDLWPELWVPALACILVGRLVVCMSKRDRPPRRVVHLPGEPVIKDDPVGRLIRVVAAIEPNCNCECKRGNADTSLATDGPWRDLAVRLDLVSKKKSRSEKYQVEKRGRELQKALCGNVPRDAQARPDTAPPTLAQMLNEAVYFLAEVGAAASMFRSLASKPPRTGSPDWLTEKIGARLRADAFVPWLDGEQVKQRLGLVDSLASEELTRRCTNCRSDETTASSCVAPSISLTRRIAMRSARALSRLKCRARPAPTNDRR